MECAKVGCSSIWITVDPENAALVQKLTGEYMLDPSSILKRGRWALDPASFFLYIPIFLVPTQARDMGIRDCFGMSIITAAHAAKHVNSSLSKHFQPDRFYVSFPQGIYDVNELNHHRVHLKTSKSFCIKYEGKTVKDNLLLGFTATPEELRECEKHVRKVSTIKVFKAEDGTIKRLPISERYSGRYFDLSEVLKHVILDEGHEYEVDWYYNIDNWEGYRDYLTSGNKMIVDEKLFRKGPLAKIGGQDD